MISSHTGPISHTNTNMAIAGAMGMSWLSTSAPTADCAFLSPTRLVHTNAANVVQIRPITPHLNPALRSSRRIDHRRSIRGPLPRSLVTRSVTAVASNVGTIVPTTITVGDPADSGDTALTS